MRPTLGGWAVSFWLLLCLSCNHDGNKPVSAPKYNVLFITMDTTRADRLGLYGFDQPTSPYLDHLAKKGIVFTRAIAQAAVTNTAHASLFTGLYPYHHGVRFLLDRRKAVLDTSMVTTAEVFKQAGARTAAFISAVPASSDFGFDQGFDVFDEEFEKSGRIAQRNGKETADRAVAWLKRTNDKFFCWVHFFDPHDPKLMPPFEICDQFRPADLSDDNAKLRAIYKAEINYMDMQIERLFQVLEEKSELDKTLVVLVADHGEALGDHQFWGHGLIYQEQIRIPLIILRPGEKQGLRVDQMVRAIDIMPSLLRWCDIEPSLWPHMDGVDLSPLLADPATPLVQTAYSEAANMQWYMHLGNKAFKDDKYYSLMNDRYKLIYHQLKPENSELYDLREDPKEARNLYAELGSVRDSLLADLRARNPMVEEISGLEGMSDEIREKLEALGYIH